MKSVTLIAINAKYCHTSLAIRSIGAFCKEKEQFGDGAVFVPSPNKWLPSLVLSKNPCYLWMAGIF